jgi:hypothetical protein
MNLKENYRTVPVPLSDKLIKFTISKQKTNNLKKNHIFNKCYKKLPFIQEKLIRISS